MPGRIPEEDDGALQATRGMPGRIPEEDEGAVAGASQGMWRFIDLTLTLFCQMYIFADHDLEPVGFDTAHLHPQFGQPVAG